MNIILDMDNTLIASDVTNIYPRPHLKQFLKFCFANFRTVSIWTAAEQTWFNIVNRIVFQPILSQISIELHKECRFYFTFTRSACKLVNLGTGPVIVKDLNDIWSKPLTFPGFNARNTFIIDDTPQTFMNNQRNGIWIPPYYGNPNDTQLLQMINLLKTNVTKMV